MVAPGPTTREAAPTGAGSPLWEGEISNELAPAFTPPAKPGQDGLDGEVERLRQDLLALGLPGEELSLEPARSGPSSGPPAAGSPGGASRVVATTTLLHGLVEVHHRDVAHREQLRREVARARAEMEDTERRAGRLDKALAAAQLSAEAARQRASATQEEYSAEARRQHALAEEAARRAAGAQRLLDQAQHENRRKNLELDGLRDRLRGALARGGGGSGPAPRAAHAPVAVPEDLLDEEEPSGGDRGADPAPASPGRRGGGLRAGASRVPMGARAAAGEALSADLEALSRRAQHAEVEAAESRAALTLLRREHASLLEERAADVLRWEQLEDSIGSGAVPGEDRGEPAIAIDSGASLPRAASPSRQGRHRPSSQRSSPTRGYSGPTDVGSAAAAAALRAHLAGLPEAALGVELVRRLGALARRVKSLPSVGLLERDLSHGSLAERRLAEDVRTLLAACREHRALLDAALVGSRKALEREREEGKRRAEEARREAAEEGAHRVAALEERHAEEAGELVDGWRAKVTAAEEEGDAAIAEARRELAEAVAGGEAKLALASAAAAAALAESDSRLELAVAEKREAIEATEAAERETREARAEAARERIDAASALAAVEEELRAEREDNERAWAGKREADRVVETDAAGRAGEAARALARVAELEGELAALRAAPLASEPEGEGSERVGEGGPRAGEDGAPREVDPRAAPPPSGDALAEALRSLETTEADRAALEEELEELSGVAAAQRVELEGRAEEAEAEAARLRAELEALREAAGRPSGDSEAAETGDAAAAASAAATAALVARVSSLESELGARVADLEAERARLLGRIADLEAAGSAWAALQAEYRALWARLAPGAGGGTLLERAIARKAAGAAGVRPEWRGDGLIGAA